MRLLLTCVSLFFATLFAQEYRATISGLVTDPSGAPIAGARVEAISVERNISYEGVTNEAGRYLTRFLPPGQYRVTAEKEGFKKVVRENVTLSAVDRLALDIRMELGAVADSVTVEAEISTLSTETASRSATIEQRYVKDVPASGA